MPQGIANFGIETLEGYRGASVFDLDQYDASLRPRRRVSVVDGDDLVGRVIGVAVGFPVLRLRGDYLAIVTLAFGEIIRHLGVAEQEVERVHAEVGL